MPATKTPAAPHPEGLPPDAPEALTKSANGEKLNNAEERSAISFLLGPQKAPRYKAKVRYETDGGTMDLFFILRALPGEQLDAIEKRNMSDGPNGLQEMNDSRVAAETVSTSTVSIVDSEGNETKPSDVAFRTQPNGDVMVDPAEALQQRFYYQSGVLMALAGEVRRISGWGPDRVGTAQRVVVDAVGNS